MPVEGYPLSVMVHCSPQWQRTSGRISMISLCCSKEEGVVGKVRLSIFYHGLLRPPLVI